LETVSETTKDATKTKPSSNPLANHFAAVTVLVPMLLASAAIGGAIYGIEQAARVSSFYWVFLSPLIYIAWLMLYLTISAVLIRHRGRRFPKPRRMVIREFADLRRPENRGGITMAICMFRATFNTSLPLVHGFEQMLWFRKLVMASYAPSVHVGPDAWVWSRIMDPDLTEIGEGAVIGYGGEFSSHVFTASPDGTMVYASAPIKIGARTTLGGWCRISLGVTIGDDVVVEQMSYVAPFTTIPDGEVWGGVPAQKLRTRDDLDFALYSRMSRRARSVPAASNANSEPVERSSRP
jgi:acetyltransferase-like isoleucine patch superfamily enzyme